MAASRALIDLPERYRPVRHIANGGMASVWEAEDRLLGRHVAIKVLAPNLAENPRSVARFEREARAAAGLSAHPHAITIYDVGEHDGLAFMVMEVLPGGSLADRLRREAPIETAEALGWIREAASALDAAHARGVVHRDVKPGNMLFDEHGRLVLADFGIARLAYDPTVTMTGEVLGTAAYVSPEQVDGRPATAASDVYSLGVVAYELLTGTRPFQAEHFAATARQHIEMPPPLPTERAPGLPSEVDEVVLRALAKDPAERWPTATAFAEALESALEGAEPARDETEATQVMPPIAPLPLDGDGDGRDGRVADGDGAAGAGRRRGAGPLLVAGLGAIGLVVLVLALASGGGDDGRDAIREADRPGSEPARERPASDSDGAAQPAPAAPAPAGEGGEDPAALNDEGFGLMNEGRYEEAIPVLQRAVAAFPEDSQDTVYAYALYNLGRSLRLAGRPDEAIPILERRMQIPNQQDVVSQELDAARAEAGGGGKPGKGPKKGKGRDKGDEGDEGGDD